MKRITKEDREKIEAYRKGLDKYPKPSVTADIIAVRPASDDTAKSRRHKTSKFAVEVLFIRRKFWPYEGHLALPGGFINPDESVEEGAKRELNEEASLKARPLIPVGTFSRPGRDMRAWIISNAFISIFKRDEGCNVKGGDDASIAKWLRVESLKISNGKFNLEFRDGGKRLFSLKGKYETDEFGNNKVTAVENNPLAFDHGEIVVQAFMKMLSFDLKNLAFYFLPEKFTQDDYFNVYRYLAQTPIEPRNAPGARRKPSREGTKK